MDNESSTTAMVTNKVEAKSPVENMASKSEIDGVLPSTDSLKSIENTAHLDATPNKSIESNTVTPATDSQNNGNAELKSTTNNDAVNKTTTTVTVNISQTKVVVDGGDKEKNVDQVASSFSAIAAETINAVENVQLAAATNSDAVQDVEMVEANDDIEMGEPIILAAEQNAPPTSTASIQPKAIEADSGTNDILMASNEAEQRIDDVEKNISNLFNGDENIVSTNSKIDEQLEKAAASSAKAVELSANGPSSVSTAAASSNEASIENHDLVSILTGTDKSSDESQPIISSSVAKSGGVAEKPATVAEAKSDVKETVTNAPTTKAEESAVDNESGIANKTAKKEIISSHSSTVSEKATVSGSEKAKISTEAANKLNGVSDATDGGSANLLENQSKSDSEASKKIKEEAKTMPTTPTTSVVSTTTENATYNITICYNKSELTYFGIEKADRSVNSATEQATAPDASTVSSTNSPPTATDADNKTTHEIKGMAALREFICNHFQILAAAPSTEMTPPTTSGRRGRAATTTPVATPSSSSSRRGGKRGATHIDIDEVEEPPKSAKKAKLATPATPTATSVSSSEKPEKAVLARWVDKKFYAGRILDKKANNKYLVLFEDGAKKTLPEEHILFGQENVLPLLSELVHALVREETYEPGLVQSVETKDDVTYYTVLCESTTVTVTASQIYLEEDQAKVILSKIASNAADNPEPGSSGAASTRKDRRQKRAEIRQTQWFSESDVSDNNESDSRPASPVTILEAVDGVQPELQHTQKESELVKICYLMERYGDKFRSVNLDPFLGPIQSSKLFKGKCFLLTCTIPIKPARANEPRQSPIQNGGNYHVDYKNRTMVFSSVPFFKDHLKQQIEAAGGTVYNNFENVSANKFRSCYLLAPFPCTTAKYVQCLASNIPAISHEWIVDSCKRCKLLDRDDYLLPSGWSIIDNIYKPWAIRGRDQRKTLFSRTTIIFTSQQNDFVQFWSRVCKAAGAKIRLVKSLTDLTASTKGYILMDDEFPSEYQNRANRFRIPIVSTVWITQSLIIGRICDPMENPKLTQLYEDDYF